MVDQWEPLSRDSVKTPLEVLISELAMQILSPKNSLYRDNKCIFSHKSPSQFPFYFQVYLELQLEGYLVDYERVPVTDEKSPKEQDFDILVGFVYTSSCWPHNRLCNLFCWDR